MKTMIRHITILMAVAMMVLLGGGCAEVNETQQSVQPKGESEAVGFDVYTQRTKTRAGTAGDLTTDGLQTGTHKNDGFGVFAYYTGENSYDENIIPNFMYNQKVAYNSSASVFDYSPIKYWPNEKGNDHISFFAYAPWVPVDATTGAATGDKTYGITGVSRNTFTGAPIVNYIATTDLSKGVDLCWGNQLNKQKPTDASKVNFNLSHSLAKLNVKVQSSIALDANTKIYIRSISFSGFTMKGALNLNNTTGTTPLWLGYDGLGRLNKDAVTIYDGRRDGHEGSLADANEGLTGLNPNLVQSTLWDDASPKPGVTNSAYNLFDNSSATTTPAYVIPTGDPVDVTIEYDIETKDDNLKGYYLSDGKTYGTSLANRITKTNVLAKLDAGNSYTLTLNLGIQDITFDATSVKDWKNDDPELVPLTFEAIQAGAKVKLTLIDRIIQDNKKVLYSIDDGESWNTYNSGTEILLANVGDIVSFKSDEVTRYGRQSGYTIYKSKFSVEDGDCYIYGNIVNLLKNKKENLNDNILRGLFEGCTRINSHPTKRLMISSNYLAFNSCIDMFKECTGLTKAPELPTQRLGSGCYQRMFQGCTNLITAPSLPATTLETSCYESMFEDCTSLVIAPALPAVGELPYQCYYSMFNNCISLTTPPPALKATTVGERACYMMFYNCTNLTSGPALHATTLSEDCYAWMFSDCTNLATAPELPAETLAQGCYAGMFFGCSSLIKAPDLISTTFTLPNSCYDRMFYHCTSLNYVKCLATSLGANSTYCWLDGVSTTGTFIKASGASWSTGPSGIPSGWTPQNAE